MQSLANRLITKQDILETERKVNYFADKINETVKKRDNSKVDYNEWIKATKEWHSYKYPIAKLYNIKDLRNGISNNRTEYFEAILLYLEVSPHFFRSGYLEQKLIQLLKQADLSESYKKRLINILISKLNKGPIFQFKPWCNLLRKKIQSPEINQIVLQVKTKNKLVEEQIKQISNIFKPSVRNQ